MHYPVYLFSGNDNKLIKKTIEKLENNILTQKNNKLNSISFFASETKTENIIEECQTYPAFSQNNKKLIKVFETELLDQKQIIEYINKTNPSSTLILISHKNKNELNKELIKAVSTSGYVKHFSTQYKDKSISFLKTQLNKINIQYDKESLLYILKEENSSFGNLETIIQKIKDYYSKETNKTLSIENLKAIIVPSQIPNIFSFIDSLFDKDIINALANFEQIITEKGNLIYLITMIYRQLKIIWTVKTYKLQKLNLNEITKETKLASFIITKTIKQEHKFTFQELETLFHKLAKLDADVRKLSDKLPKTLFEMFIIQFKN